MRALRVIALLVVQTEPGGHRWPVGPGDQPAPLRATYGQLQGEGSSADLHLGLDIMAPPGDPVCAIEAGTVLKVRRNSIEDCAVLIESETVKDRAFLYLHLAGSIPVRKHEVVKVGTPIGFIASKNSPTEVTHLHLSRVGKGYKSHTLSGVDELSTGNPLALLKRADLGDSTAPVVVPMADGSLLGIRANDSGLVSAGLTTSQDLDVIVHAYDRDLSGHWVAPYEMQLTVTSATGTQVFPPLTLDDQLGKVSYLSLYNMDSPYPSSGSTKKGDYDYYFILTNAGTPPTTANTWTATSGDYKLHVTIRDVSGNNTPPIDQNVHIP